MNLQSYPNCTLEIFIQDLFTSVSNLIHKKGNPTCFELNRVPKLSLDKYIARVVNYVPCTVEAYIIAVAYLHRISNTYPWVINKYSVHTLFVTSLLIACKYHDDIFHNNKFYAQVGGISTLILNKLELEFLKYISFECYISINEFKQFSHILNFKNSDQMCELYYSISPSNYLKFPRGCSKWVNVTIK